MQAAAEQQRLEAEVSSLHDEKASLQTQAQRLSALEDQLQAIGLANAQASQVGTHNAFLAFVLQPAFRVSVASLSSEMSNQQTQLPLDCYSVWIDPANGTNLILLPPVPCPQAYPLSPGLFSVPRLQILDQLTDLRSWLFYCVMTGRLSAFQGCTPCVGLHSRIIIVTVQASCFSLMAKWYFGLLQFGVTSLLHLQGPMRRSNTQTAHDYCCQHNHR